MQAASTEFGVDGVDPRVALDAALPPTGSPATSSSSSSTSVPSSSANPLGSTRPIGVRFLVVVLERSTRLDSPLRNGEGDFHSSMPCARVTCGGRDVTGSM